MEHVVVAPTTTDRLSIMFTGTRAECLTFIRRRNRLGQPTHFCYIVRNTWRAKERFRQAHGLKGEV